MRQAAFNSPPLLSNINKHVVIDWEVNTLFQLSGSPMYSISYDLPMGKTQHTCLVLLRIQDFGWKEIPGSLWYLCPLSPSPLSACFIRDSWNVKLCSVKQAKTGQPCKNLKEKRAACGQISTTKSITFKIKKIKKSELFFWKDIFKWTCFYPRSKSLQQN